MALTPEDVVNKRFQPTKFREGYDQDEVDDFLDEVVVELRRLNQENEELRQRLVSSDARIAELQRGASGPAAITESPVPARPEQSAEQVQPQFVAAPVEPAPVAAPVPAPVAYASSDQNAIDSGSTNNLLQLARKLHEEHVREGIEKRDALIAEGHATAARVVSEAEAAHRAQLTALDGEKSALESQKTALEQQKTVLEQQIEDLRTFEREYRQKLKSYIEGQLKELDATEPVSVAAESTPASPFESVPATGGSFDSGSTDDDHTPPPTSFQGFGGN
jgi:DivIVA domain-containing protein